MKSFYIDPLSNDLTLQNYNIRMTTTYAEWLSAKIEARLRTYYGEWFVNRTIGIKYFEKILGKQIDINTVQVILGNVIKNTNGVKELVSFNVVYDNSLRKYTYIFVVLADTDETIEGGSAL